MSYYHFTPVSGNAKTGPIPVTTSGKSTCPHACPLKSHGCYAEYGPLKLHWDAVSRGERGGTLSEVCDQIRHLPKFQLWRWGQAGDLPGDGTQISMPDMRALVKANLNRRGFAFTHYDPTNKINARAIKYANLKGFAVNLSANSLEHADKLYSLGIAPVVVLLPADQTKALKTPGGRHVSVCPASVRDDTTCARCGICAVNDRKAIIGFPAHGTGVKKAQTIFFRRVGQMTLTKIEPKHALDAYIGMDAVTHLDASYKEVHTVVLAWVDSDLAPGGPPDYVRSGQDSHGPYPSRVEAIAAARDFGRTVNAHRKLIGLPPKQWRYR